jgi:sulfur-carrier protein
VTVRVLIPSALRSYTQAAQTEANGATLGAVLEDLDRRYPGIRFRVIDEQNRVRRHMRIFVNGVSAESMATTLSTGDEVILVLALSGG